ncbi:hypothetical protein NDI43_08805 [Microcoleus vaginatus GB2-A3]|uniref:hypothetical protein n=1 Tax=Microcoleus TaxID=44471 RepID=UPI002FD59001
MGIPVPSGRGGCQIKSGSIGINITHSFLDGSALSSISCRSCNRKRYQSVEDAIADGIQQTA